MTPFEKVKAAAGPPVFLQTLGNMSAPDASEQLNCRLGGAHRLARDDTRRRLGHVRPGRDIGGLATTDLHTGGAAGKRAADQPVAGDAGIEVVLPNRVAVHRRYALARRIGPREHRGRQHPPPRPGARDALSPERERFCSENRNRVVETQRGGTAFIGKHLT